MDEPRGPGNGRMRYGEVWSLSKRYGRHPYYSKYGRREQVVFGPTDDCRDWPHAGDMLWNLINFSCFSKTPVPYDLYARTHFCYTFTNYVDAGGERVRLNLLGNSIVSVDIAHLGSLDDQFKTELTSLYAYMRVVASAIDVVISGVGSSVKPYDSQWYVGIYGDTDAFGAFTSNTISQMSMAPDCKVVEANLSNESVRMNHYLKSAHVCNVSDVEYATNTDFNAHNAVPTTRFYWHVFAEPMRSIVHADFDCEVTMAVTVTHYVHCSQPVPHYDEP